MQVSYTASRFIFSSESGIDEQYINDLPDYLEHCDVTLYYGGPHLPRQNLLFHGKTYFSTAKLTFSRQNLLFHGKTYFSTAKLTFSRQNFLFHGKTYFSFSSFYRQIPGCPTRESIGRDRLEARNGKVSFAVEK